MLCRGSEQIREDVGFALTCQPDEPCAALCGDGHSVVHISWFAGKVTPRWMQGIETDLFREHSGILDDNWEMITAHGVYLLDFHNWVARLVKRHDPKFSWPSKIGRGSQATAIRGALADWCGATSAEPRGL